LQRLSSIGTDPDNPVSLLVNTGISSVTAPNYDMKEALNTWNEALTLAETSIDLIMKAKILSNIACVYKNQGKYDDAYEVIRDAWVITSQYVEYAAINNNSSPWLKLAINQLDLKNDLSRRKTMSSSTEEPGGQAQNDQLEYSNGPPIVIWLLQLTTNIGNIQYLRGDFAFAARSFETCMSLCETSLEQFPLPPELMLIMAAANPLSPVGGAELSVGISHRSKNKKGHYKLSVFHREVILAQARSLTYLGSCFLALGVATSSLQYQFVACSFIEAITSKIPSLCTPSICTTSNIDPSIEFVLLEVAVFSNMARAWYATGDLGKAIETYEKVNRLFAKLKSVKKPNRPVSYTQLQNARDQVVSLARSISDPIRSEGMKRGLEEIRQSNNIGLMYLHIGTCIKTIQWTRELQNQDANENTDEPTSWSVYYDEFSSDENESPISDFSSEQLIISGLDTFIRQAKDLHQMNDMFGLVFSFLNIGMFEYFNHLASCYLKLNRPFLALYYISKAIDPHSTKAEKLIKASSFPALLLRETLFLISQVLFSIYRVISNSSASNTAEFIKLCGGDKIRDFLLTNKAPSNLVYDLNFEMIIELLAFTSVKYRSLIKVKNSEEIHLLLLRSENMLVNYSKSLPSRIQSKFIYSSNIDILKMKLLVIDIAKTKVCWTLAELATSEDVRVFWYNNGMDALDYAVLGIYFDGSLFTAETIQKSKEHVIASKQGVPSHIISIAADFIQASNTIKPDVGSALIAGFIPTGLFPILAHLLFTVVRRSISAEIHTKIGIVDRLEILETMQDALISICRDLYLSNFNMCKLCFDSMVSQCETQGTSLHDLIKNQADNDPSVLTQLVGCIHSGVIPI
jgi:tetratricopeptide (TPR) repeat protein